MFGFLTFWPFWVSLAVLLSACAWGWYKDYSEDTYVAASIAYVSTFTTIAFMAAQW